MYDVAVTLISNISMVLGLVLEIAPLRSEQAYSGNREEMEIAQRSMESSMNMFNALSRY